MNEILMHSSQQKETFTEANKLYNSCPPPVTYCNCMNNSLTCHPLQTLHVARREVEAEKKEIGQLVFHLCLCTLTAYRSGSGDSDAYIIFYTALYSDFIFPSILFPVFLFFYTLSPSPPTQSAVRGTWIVSQGPLKAR